MPRHDRVRRAAELLERRHLLSASLLADVNVATNPSVHDNGSYVYSLALTRSGGTTYFRADDGIHGPELWRTDGTAVGTRLVAGGGGPAPPGGGAIGGGPVRHV